MASSQLPPHLPPKACNIKWHERMRTLPWLLFFIVISGLVAAATAVLVASWVVPLITPIGQSTYIVGKTDPSGRLIPDARFAAMVEERIVNVYDQRKKIAGSFYPEQALLAKAMMLSSDGWAVAYMPEFMLGDERQWEGVGSNGQHLVIENVKKNPVQPLVYIKFSGSGLPFTLFAEWRSVGIGNPVWAISKTREWQSVMIADLKRVKNSDVEAISTIGYQYQLSDEVLPGAVLITPSGAFVGIADQAGAMLDAFFTYEKRGDIFSDQSIGYNSLPVSGTVVRGFMGTEVVNQTTGFYVSGISGPTTSSVRVGDIILRVQGERLIEQWLWRQIMMAPEEVSLTVLREGIVIDLTVKKEIVVKQK